MNPAYGIIAWVVIGALAGWIGSKIMGTDARQGAIANIAIGITGALLGGWLARFFLSNDAGTNGLVGSFLTALAGSCVVIFAWKMVTRRPA